MGNVKVYLSEDIYMAEIVDLGLVEFGETPQDALNNLEILFYVKVDDIQQELRSKYENVRAHDLM